MGDPTTTGGHDIDPLTPVLTRRWPTPRSWSIETYEQLQGYQALRHALSTHPDRIIALVKHSGLRGRGGAGFPTGLDTCTYGYPRGETRTAPRSATCS